MRGTSRQRENKMNMTEHQTITFENPPIDEVVCGVLFDSIKGLQAGHLGLLWQKFGSDFPVMEDQNLLGPLPTDEMTRRDTPPLPRVWMVHKDENELIQVQFNRFLHNWRKRRPSDKYPNYKTVIENFEKYFSCFQDFLAGESLGAIVPNRYELTYIDLILENEGWETLNNLGRVFTDFISLKGQNALSTDIREINWQMVFGMPNDLGQLQLLIRNARRIPDNRHLIRIEFTAFSNQPYKPMRDWFDSAHDVIFDLFTNIISNEIQEKFWGRKLCKA